MEKRIIAAVAAALIVWALFGTIAGLIVGGIGLLVAAFGSFENTKAECRVGNHAYGYYDTCVHCGRERDSEVSA